MPETPKGPQRPGIYPTAIVNPVQRSFGAFCSAGNCAAVRTTPAGEDAGRWSPRPGAAKQLLVRLQLELQHDALLAFRRRREGCAARAATLVVEQGRIDLVVARAELEEHPGSGAVERR